jgi:hypothetical protein
MEEKTKLLEIAESLLEGAYDLHIHTSPDVKERCVSDVEAAQQARDVGMAGILIKNHHTLTADRAAIATNVTDFPTYGSLALNLSVGGLNIWEPCPQPQRWGAKSSGSGNSCQNGG